MINTAISTSMPRYLLQEKQVILRSRYQRFGDTRWGDNWGRCGQVDGWMTEGTIEWMNEWMNAQRMNDNWGKVFLSIGGINLKFFFSKYIFKL